MYLTFDFDHYEPGRLSARQTSQMSQNSELSSMNNKRRSESTTINDKRQITTNVTWFFDMRTTNVKDVTEIKLKQKQFLSTYARGADNSIY